MLLLPQRPHTLPSSPPATSSPCLLGSATQLLPPNGPCHAVLCHESPPPTTEQAYMSHSCSNSSAAPSPKSKPRPRGQGPPAVIFTTPLLADPGLQPNQTSCHLGTYVPSAQNNLHPSPPVKIRPRSINSTWTIGHLKEIFSLVQSMHQNVTNQN